MLRVYILIFLGVLLSFSSFSQNPHLLKDELKLYPNPVTEGTIYIDFGNGSTSYERVEILDVTGTKVFDAMLNTENFSKHKLDLSALAYGNYFVLIKTESEVFSARITIN
ncbi:MAG: T9SS type A sorting domain-containing protein [Flavobacteriales bacterium]|nr:T9SS type A sorting domain-containing protein [Flavobacteriales bacterium]